MNIIDIIILAILALSLVSGMYKGFITSALALLGFVGSWIGALASYNHLVTLVRNNEGIMKFLNGLFQAADMFKSQTLANLSVQNVTAEQIDQAVQELNIPVIGTLFKNNVIGRVFEGTAKTMSEYLSQTLLNATLNIVAFILMFIVIYVAALLIVNLINNVFRFPALRHLDWALGGIFGIVRGVVIVLLIFSVVPTVSAALTSMDIPQMQQLLDESLLSDIFAKSSFVRNAINALIA